MGVRLAVKIQSRKGEEVIRIMVYGALGSGKGSRVFAVICALSIVGEIEAEENEMVPVSVVRIDTWARRGSHGEALESVQTRIADWEGTTGAGVDGVCRRRRETGGRKGR